MCGRYLNSLIVYFVTLIYMFQMSELAYLGRWVIFMYRMCTVKRAVMFEGVRDVSA